MKAEEFVMAELDKDRQKAEGTLPEGEEPKSNVKFMIAADAPIVLSRACELLIREMTCRAWQHTERNRRRTLQQQDLHAAVGESEVFDFLIDIVPRVATPSPRPGLSPPEAMFAAAMQQQQAAATTLAQPPPSVFGGGDASTIDPTGGVEPTLVVGQPTFGIPPGIAAASPPTEPDRNRQQQNPAVIAQNETATEGGANAVAPPNAPAVWQDRLPHEQTNE